MIAGNREEWTKLLPIVQAFVDGKTVQHLGYDKRWADTEDIYQLRMGHYRVKDGTNIEGTWEQKYKFVEQGSVDGPIGHGNFTWAGSNQDTPPFKNNGGFTLVGEPVFVPKISESKVP